MGGAGEDKSHIISLYCFFQETFWRPRPPHPVGRPQARLCKTGTCLDRARLCKTATCLDRARLCKRGDLPHHPFGTAPPANFCKTLRIYLICTSSPPSARISMMIFSFFFVLLVFITNVWSRFVRQRCLPRILTMAEENVIFLRGATSSPPQNISKSTLKKIKKTIKKLGIIGKNRKFILIF